MDQIGLSKIENERWNFENAIKDVQDDFKDVDNGGEITTTRFIIDLNALATALQDLKNKFSPTKESKSK